MGRADQSGVGAMDIRIFYPNGAAVQFKVENGQEVNGADLLQLMSENLNIDYGIAKEALAIWIVSPLLELQLKPHHIPYTIYAKWPAFLWRLTTADEDDIALDEPLLVLRRNMLLTIDREREFANRHERLEEMMYLHARDEFLSGRYLVDIDITLELVGLQMAIEFGSYSGVLEEALNLIYDNLHELAPAPQIKAIKSFHLFGLRLIKCKSGLEHRVVQEYRTASQHYKSIAERRKAFLNILRREKFYGAAFYSGTIDSSRVHSPHSHHHDHSPDVEWQGDGHSDHSPASSTRSTSTNKPTISMGSIFSFFRNRLHPLHHAKNGASHNRRHDEILIAINSEYITLIGPRRHKIISHILR